MNFTISVSVKFGAVLQSRLWKHKYYAFDQMLFSLVSASMLSQLKTLKRRGRVTHMYQWTEPLLVHVMICRMFKEMQMGIYLNNGGLFHAQQCLWKQLN